MRVAVDLDNTITAPHSAEFWQVLTELLIPEHEIYIISDRDKDPETKIKTKEELASLGIRFTELIITEKKATAIEQLGITVFFEDTDEYLRDCPEDVLVFKVREPGNFSFAKKKWIGSERTTHLI
jgi:hypothetical protein